MARRRDTAILGEALQDCLVKMQAELPFQLVGVWRNWERLVGEDMASMIRPLGRHKTTLLVGAEDHAAQQDATYAAPEILEAVNDFLGQECFDKMQVDLLMGATPLDEHAQKASAPGHGGRRFKPPRPDELGGLFGSMREDSPAAQCYAAYVRRFGGVKE